jgi:hypothetical protein
MRHRKILLRMAGVISSLVRVQVEHSQSTSFHLNLGSPAVGSRGVDHTTDSMMVSSYRALDTPRSCEDLLNEYSN